MHGRLLDREPTVRAFLALICIVVIMSAAQAQIISIDEFETRLDIGTIHTELTTYERKDAIYALFSAKAPFLAAPREFNVTKDGCHEVFYSGTHHNEDYTVTLMACSSSAYCRDERQYLAIRAVYTLMTMGSGRLPQIKPQPLLKTIRPALRNLPC
jgi:hypothetical protein